MNIIKGLLPALALCICSTYANAQLKVVISQPVTGFGYEYGGYNWTSFTSTLNATAASKSATITTVGLLNDASILANADALLLNQRWTSGSLSATEISNISAFINAGKRVLLIGENSSWTSWDNQILGLVGDHYLNQVTGYSSATTANPLTAGVSSIYLPTAGSSAGSSGTALFASNFSRLYGSSSNVLTVLDVNVFDRNYSSYASNQAFTNNVANWLFTAAPSSSSTGAVPEPSTYGLIGALALVGLIAFRRIQKKS